MPARRHCRTIIRARNVVAKPIRVQRRRAKGWKMPPNTVCVDRSTKWGNPFMVGRHGTREDCVRLFAHMLNGYICLSEGPGIEAQNAYRDMVIRDFADLRGKNLACWCPPGAKCHADVLLALNFKKLAAHSGKLAAASRSTD